MGGVAVTGRTGDPRETDADTRVIPVFEEEPLDDASLQQLVDSGEAKPGLRSLAVMHESGDGGLRKVILVGAGKRAELDPERARLAAAAAAGRARDIGSKSISWASPGSERVAGAIVEGTLLALYRFDRYKSAEGDEEDGGGVTSLEVVEDGDEASLRDEVERAHVRADAQNAARDLQNTPSNDATPAFLADRARELADAHDKLEFEAWDRERITEAGMNAFAGVARGSYEEPRLIVLRYEGADSGPLLGYVGKAGTFDTGGAPVNTTRQMAERKF